MHILIIPSEELVPAENHTAGIFQWHQAKIIKEGGHKVGAISIKQAFSIPMLIRAIAYRRFGKKVNNITDTLSYKQIFKLGFQKIFSITHFLQTEVRDGIPILRIEGFFFTQPKDNLNQYGWIKAGLAAYKEYKKNYGSPDLIHAHNAIYAGMLAMEIKAKYNIPFLLTEHSTAFARKTINNKKILKLVRKVYEESTSLYAVSNPFCQLLNSMFQINRFTSLPNVLDSYLENQPFQKLNKNSSEFIFLNIAELHPKKDQLGLIKAFQNLVQNYTNARLWIGGDGALANELKDYISKEGLKDKVQFLGLLDRKKIVEVINQCDCFVLSSKYETFGVVVIEAMLFGKPVIVTACGGPEDFVIEQVGKVVQKENVEQLSEAMAKMIENINSYRPEQIREYAIKNYGREKFLNSIESIYRSVKGDMN